MIKFWRLFVVVVVCFSAFSTQANRIAVYNPALNRDKLPGAKHFVDLKDYLHCQEWIKKAGWVPPDDAILWKVFHIVAGKKYRVNDSVDFNIAATHHLRLGLTF